MGVHFEIRVTDDSEEARQLATILGEMLESLFYREDSGLLEHYANRLKEEGFEVIRLS